MDAYTLLIHKFTHAWQFLIKQLKSAEEISKRRTQNEYSDLFYPYAHTIQLGHKYFLTIHIGYRTRTSSATILWYDFGLGASLFLVLVLFVTSLAWCDWVESATRIRCDLTVIQVRGTSTVDVPRAWHVIAFMCGCGGWAQLAETRAKRGFSASIN